MKRRKPNPELSFMLRWLASKGIEVSPEEFRAVEGKFHRKDLPPEQQAMVDKILAVSDKHYDEWLRISRQAAKIKQQRMERGQ